MKAEEEHAETSLPGESRPPLLFVHGMWHGAWCWKELEPLFLKAGLDAQSFNLSFHGDKYAGNRGRLCCAMVCTYLEDLRREVKKFPTTPILVGHSLGCHLIEVLMAELRPPAAILLAPTRRWIFTCSVGRFVWHHPLEFLRLFFGLTLWPPIRTLELCRELLFAPDFPDSDLRDLHKKWLQNESHWVAVQLLIGGLLPFLNIGGKPAAPFGTPVYVVGGDLDRAVLPENVAQVAAFHSADFKVFPGMAHDLMLGPRHPEVAAALLEWLAKHGLMPGKQG